MTNIIDGQDNVFAFPIGLDFIDMPSLPKNFCTFRPGIDIARNLRAGQRVNLWNRPSKSSILKGLIGIGVVKMVVTTTMFRSVVHSQQSDWALAKGFTGATAREWVKEMMEETYMAFSAQPGSAISVVYLSTI